VRCISPLFNCHRLKSQCHVDMCTKNTDYELEPDVIDDSGSLVDLECIAGSIL